MRYAIYRVAWALASPFRIYLRKSPETHGKAMIIRKVLAPIRRLGPTDERIALPDGPVILANMSSVVGRLLSYFGDYEPAERSYLSNIARSRGGTFFDVGANIGVFAVSMGLAARDQGTVIAIEPDPSTASSLSRNVLANNLTNVRVIEALADAQSGRAKLLVREDPAFSGVDSNELPVTQEIEVDVVTIDKLWADAGHPRVTALKVDVEGAEIGVLNGAHEVLRECGPDVIVEAADSQRSDALNAWFQSHNYTCVHRQDFLPWNLLFVARSSDSSSPAVRVPASSSGAN